jgi:hypothetical protein
LASFVVAEVTKGTELPFNNKRPGERFGLIVPSDSSIEAKTFFRAGNTYSYGAPGSQRDIVIKGSFSSPSDAESRYPEVSGSWHTLSTGEVKNLGRVPWTRK